MAYLGVGSTRLATVRSRARMGHTATSRVCFFTHTPEQFWGLTPKGSSSHIGCDSSSRLGQDPFLNAWAFSLYFPLSSPMTGSPPCRQVETRFLVWLNQCRDCRFKTVVGF
ncbi:Uncharacterized protein Fot_12894 [Forsythia ovata]|uniref:Uncharacterized protein n=1 Tax=Forsythia ovata TaxID=205694 RepID=A0ABD1W1X3_9LAMI